MHKKQQTDQPDVSGASATDTEGEQIKGGNEVEDLKGQLRRALADYQNLQRRVNDERSAIGKFAAQAVIIDFLPVVEQLEQVVETAPEDEQKSAWFAAVKMSVAQLKDILRKEGVIEINPIDQQFDPNEHEAVDVVEGDEDNKVVVVLQKGYKLNDKIIAAAKVKVSKSNEGGPTI